MTISFYCVMSKQLQSVYSFVMRYNLNFVKLVKGNHIYLLLDQSGNTTWIITWREDMCSFWIVFFVILKSFLWRKMCSCTEYFLDRCKIRNYSVNSTKIFIIVISNTYLSISWYFEDFIWRKYLKVFFTHI